MNKVFVPSPVPSVAMSTKNTCNKENIRSKKYVPVSPSDDVDPNNHAQCQSPPVPDEDKQSQELNKCDESCENEAGVVDKKKFVEAPLPKTNPWTANKSSSTHVHPKEPVKEKDPIVGEKRILLPQQQTVCEYH